MRSTRLRPLRALGLAAALALLGGAGLEAQYWREARVPPRLAPSQPPDRNFTFCRIMYASIRREAGGQGWRTDYPAADVNFMIRLAELTGTAVSMDGEGAPNHYVVRLTDDALFNCPFTMASDVGTASFSPEESERLRTYLLKGGFLWVDDFWGTAAWSHWAGVIGQVLPAREYPIVEVTTMDPLFQALYRVPRLPQITSIQFWRSVGGATTSERGSDSGEPHVRAIRDRHGRIMVLMTHNTDIADAWEREGEDQAYFDLFAADGYALGINVLVHAMAH